MFEAEDRKFANLLKSLEQFTQTMKGQNNFWYQNTFLTCYWRFLISKNIIQTVKNHWDLGTCKLENDSN